MGWVPMWRISPPAITYGSLPTSRRISSTAIRAKISKSRARFDIHHRNVARVKDLRCLSLDRGPIVGHVDRAPFTVFSKAPHERIEHRVDVLRGGVGHR